MLEVVDRALRPKLLRERVEAMARGGGEVRLDGLLARVDPESALRIQRNDRLRVIRALEVFRHSGRTLTAHHRDEVPMGDGRRWLVLGLDPPREALRAAVEERTRAMFDRGLLDEVRRVRARYGGSDLRPLRAIGYRQAAAVVRGEATVDAAQRDMVKETMRYAKRQLTWFRHQEDVCWFARAADAQAFAREWLG